MNYYLTFKSSFDGLKVGRVCYLPKDQQNLEGRERGEDGRLEVCSIVTDDGPAYRCAISVRPDWHDHTFRRRTLVRHAALRPWTCRFTKGAGRYGQSQSPAAFLCIMKCFWMPLRYNRSATGWNATFRLNSSAISACSLDATSMLTELGFLYSAGTLIW